MKKALLIFEKWLLKHKNNILVYYFAKITLTMIETVEKVIHYFKKDISVYCDYIHDEHGKHPYTVNGFVLRKGVTHSFTSIPWEDIDDIIDQLNEEDEPLIFNVTHGVWYQEFYLPKWARKMLAEKLSELKDKHN